MGAFTVVYVTLGVGVVLLVLVVLAALGPVRRFTRASAALRVDLARGTDALHELRDARPDLRRPTAE
jgi:hypothetical protein